MISIIAAMAENRVIGINNTIPWKLSDDFKHFKKVTSGHPIIMGRKTFESLPKILPERNHVVVTSQPAYFSQHGETSIVHSLRQAIIKAKTLPGSEEIFIIGGENIYRQALQFVERIYLTIVHINIKGDAFFPMFDILQWKKVHEKHYRANEKNQFDFSIAIFDRCSIV